MKKLIQLEEWGQFAGALLLLYLQPISMAWWWWVLIFFAPDIGMLGYLFGNRIGAISYNIFHHKAVAIGLAIAGWYFEWPVLMLTGLILFAHSSFDRALGYGLKYFSGFKHTSMGSGKW